jgi:hypothetical protein
MQLNRLTTLILICVAVVSLNFIYLWHLETGVRDDIFVVSSDRPPEQQQRQPHLADRGKSSAAASLVSTAQQSKHVNKAAASSDNQQTGSVLLPRCPMPNFDDLNQTIPEQSVIDKFLSNWNYYSKISYENSDMSSRVRNFTSDPPPPISESNIPHRLVFTHFADLFDCTRSAANSSSPLLYNLAENAKHTVNLYAEIWYDVEYVFLTDDDCVTVVNEAMPELVRWFENPMLEGDCSYRSNLCYKMQIVSS